VATPLTADQLVAALKAEGVTVTEHRSRLAYAQPRRAPGDGGWGPVNGSVVHHTGPYISEAQDPRELLLVWNGSALPGPLATGVIGKKGDVYLIGNGRANHAGGGDPRVLAAVTREDYGDYPPATHEHEGSFGAVDGNSHFYGWECVNKGDGKETWPAAQYVAIVKTQAAIIRAHRAKGDSWGDGGKSIIGHLEWSDWKSDPKGIPMPKLRAEGRCRLPGPAGRQVGRGGDQGEADAGAALAALEAAVAALARRSSCTGRTLPAAGGGHGRYQGGGRRVEALRRDAQSGTRGTRRSSTPVRRRSTTSRRAPCRTRGRVRSRPTRSTLAARQLAENLAPLPSINCAPGVVSSGAGQEVRRQEDEGRVLVRHRLAAEEAHADGCDWYLTYGSLPIVVEPTSRTAARGCGSTTR
jgi:hypothetical protein